jgi:hypothetical protein
VEFPKTDNVKSGCTVENREVVIQVDESNLAAFLDDAAFVERLWKRVVSWRVARQEYLQ